MVHGVGADEHDKRKKNHRVSFLSSDFLIASLHLQQTSRIGHLMLLYFISPQCLLLFGWKLYLTFYILWQEYTTCPYIQAKENEPCHEKENLHPSQKTDKVSNGHII